MDQNNLHPEKSNQELVYDYVFIGMGASNSLILKKLIESNAFNNKNVAVIEAQQKNENDKTYCFWASPNDRIVKELSCIIKHSYNKIEINKGLPQDISSQPYYYVKSIDLYLYTASLIKQNKIARFEAKCFDITENPAFSIVHTDIGILQAKFIFDSRPPKIDSSKHIHLHQSFYGIQVKFKKEVFDINTFEMMNFDVEQNQFTQFFYVLPFYKNEALIELTRFGAEKIDLDYAKDVLSQKIATLFGHYELLAEEIGCIPMTNYQFPDSKMKGLIHTGARANLIKPSTGYGFKNMFLFAEEVAKKISKNEFKHISLRSKSRFKFYDSLLLIILLRWPYLGKEIFSKLFSAQKISTIFCFLDEKTTLFQEIKIFASLPFTPFIKAACLHIFKNTSFRSLATALTLCIYFLLSTIASPHTETYMYSLIVFGLLLIGIPHGAVDHLLKKDSKPLVQFIAKYLLIIALNFTLWIYAPKIALILFLIYSAFHFGESELEKLNQAHALKKAIKGGLIGALILFIIVFGHWQESISVLKNIQNLLPQKLFEINISSAIFTFLIGSAFAGLYICLIQNKKHFLQLSLILFLGLFMPLIAAFSLYFICQHSFNAWQDLKNGLSLNSIQLYKKAWPYLLGAIAVFIAILAFNSIDKLLSTNILSYFFIFLSCISLPHIFFMHGFYVGQQENNV